MNDMHDITSELRDWIKEPSPLREDGVERVARLVHDTPQQRGWLPIAAGRSGRVPTFAGGAVVGAVMVVLVGLLLALIGTPEPVSAPAAMSPSPSPISDTPAWPGVSLEFVPDGCSDACATDDRVWAVEAEHRGDIGSTQVIAFGPTGAPWFVSDDTLWRLGEPGVIGPSLGRGGFGDNGSVTDLAVAAAGTAWVASDRGLRSFDGETWTDHWTETGLADLAIAPDGTVHAVGGGGGGAEITVVRVDGDDVSSEVVEVLSREYYPTAIAVDDDGRTWVGAIASGYVPPAQGESLLARSDGLTWEVLRPESWGTVDAAIWGLANSNGELWANLVMLARDGGGITHHIGRFDGQEWDLYPATAEEQRDLWISLAIGGDGTVWLIAGGGEDGSEGGVLAFDRQELEWTRFLGEFEFGALAIAPDGTVVATTIPGFDEDGRLFAIRR